MTPRILAIALSFSLVASLAPRGAHAFSSGVGPGSCMSGICHGGSPGTLPVVTLTGPTTVAANSSNIYEFIISSPPGQLDGGFSASSADGDLTLGGPDSGGTKIVPSGFGNNAITHSAKKTGTGTEVRFSFVWEAPGVGGPATLDVWGNAVNSNGTPTGDGATLSSLVVTVEPPPPPPVPATSPWSQAALAALLLAAGALFVLRRRGAAL